MLEALPLVVGVRAALWLLLYRREQRLVLGGRGTAPDAHGAARPERITEAVRRASRVVPRATCLTQALAAQVLLSRAGYTSRVWIGVARDGSAGLDAHAWVELDGSVILGATPDRRYVPLLALGGAGA